jgi:exopolyphosphatase/guanosine-5'-triphosphate,3'-diphosphate pyrophosphatase
LAGAGETGGGTGGGTAGGGGVPAGRGVGGGALAGQLGGVVGAPGAGPGVAPEAAAAARAGALAGDIVAAVDLGSNSFHMVIARVVGGEPVVLDRLREQVQIARGLGRGGALRPRAEARALACLERFGQRVRSVPPTQVRAVGTDTIRQLRSPGEFLKAAEKALGHPVEVVSGQEEARLIYLGVAHSLPDVPGPRLVVDIGGGSTELILGERFEPLEARSLPLGCVRLSLQHFPGGAVTKEAMEDAILEAGSEVQAVERAFQDMGWDHAVGSSGTIRATASVLRANGWAERGIPAAGLKKLRKALVAAGTAKGMEGLKPSRATVFPGGIAILSALFDGLRIEQMSTSRGALREGVLYDLLGRIRHEDVRERTIRAFQDRYAVDRAQATRVERRALDLLLRMTTAWFPDPVEASRTLAWAARLHEVGLAVSYSGHQRHGAYLIAHSHMPGFSRDDQVLVAAVVGAHRGRVGKRQFASLAPQRAEMALRLTALLRLAVLLHRGRERHPMSGVRLTGAGSRLIVSAPAAFAEEHPLTWRDLLQERRALQKVDLDLEVIRT